MSDDLGQYTAQVDAFTRYHLEQEQGGRGSLGLGPALPALGHALSGSVATASAKSLLYPLSLVITRLQVQRQLRQKGEANSAARSADKEYDGLFDAARKIHKTEGGIGAFYTGVAGDVSKGILDSFLFFLAYNYIRQAEHKRNGGNRIPVVKELAVGVAAGSFSKFFTSPIENIVTRQQTAALVNARDPNSGSDPASVRDIARQIYNERGLAGFWSGYGEAVMLTLNPAITFAVDNVLTRLLPREQRERPTPGMTFLLAALSKAIATTITYPAMLAKSRAQVSGGIGSEEEESLEEESMELLEKPSLNATPQRRKVKRGLERVFSIFAAQYAILVALRKIYREEGVAGLYSGVEAEVLKGFIQHGFTMMVKERAQVAVLQSYYLLLRLTKQWPEELKKAQDGARELVDEAGERASNLGETVTEGARRVAERATGRE
ncbi:mitochondrial carrier domain-containing protein [Neohortaea acidophila]|uniref:Mitochondrial carrier domain-containing protein n=1 Tax=Neohortaea acidophila TaxID=245834 RepID=A0A6A6PT77_9PEZI|nr:mitochondrial carrier domain-containing protein [Neohortaea acidophila]KAF2482693.1 mitochondrial carrier domain-containing protein [Neohortaea acidophila]